MLLVSDYQEKAQETAVYRKNMTAEKHIQYSALGLVGEAGEIANQVKKIYRDDNGIVTPERQAKLGDEIGDVSWYLACLAEDLGLDWEEILYNNIKKLRSRMERGTISGSGDNR